MTGQGEMCFRSEEEAQRLARRVDAMPHAAPDGQEWEAQVIRLALEAFPPGTSFLPSDLRRMASALGLEPHNPNRWGGLAAKLLQHGFVRTAEERTSVVKSRNAAKERVWQRRPA